MYWWDFWGSCAAGDTACCVMIAPVCVIVWWGIRSEFIRLNCWSISGCDWFCVTTDWFKLIRELELCCCGRQFVLCCSCLATIVGWFFPMEFWFRGCIWVVWFTVGCWYCVVSSCNLDVVICDIGYWDACSSGCWKLGVIIGMLLYSSSATISSGTGGNLFELSNSVQSKIEMNT